MTVTLTLHPEIEAGAIARASARGLTLDLYLQSLIEEECRRPEPPIEHQSRSMVDDIPVFGVGRPMPVAMIEDTLDAIRNDRSAEPLRSAREDSSAEFVRSLRRRAFAR